MEIFIVDPNNGKLVEPSLWMEKSADPTSAQLVAIVWQNHGLLLSKKALHPDGNDKTDGFFAEYHAKFFKPETDVSRLGANEFRLPNRHEAIEIYDARFHGLDDAMELIGGERLDLFEWAEIWLCDRAPVDGTTKNYAFCFNFRWGSINPSYVSNQCAIRPVCSFDVHPAQE